MRSGEAIAGAFEEGVELEADPLVAGVDRSVEAAQDFLMRVRRGEYWCAELESNTTITAEYVLLYQALGLDLGLKQEALVRYLSSRQKVDGSFGIALNHPGDVSTTAETYLALRLLGIDVSDERLRRAEQFIRASGGLSKVRVFTRINLALFGLFPWEAIPAVPPEFLLLPSFGPVNIYRLSSWARSTMVPLFVVFHYRPLFALPNGRSTNNDWLDHLWLDPSNKKVPYRASVAKTLWDEGPGWKAFFNACDVLLRLYDRVHDWALVRPLRNRALKACEEWVLERQERTGDWAGIFPPMLNGVLALHLLGHPLTSDPVRRGLEAIEAFSLHDSEGFRVEACQSPVWDSILGLIGLLDSGMSGEDARLKQTRRWIEKKQITDDRGDWKVYNPKGPSGGWSFEYSNTWYPDVDDTAAVVIGFLKQDPSSRDSQVVRRAVGWMLSMQNRDGGWGAFDKNNDREFLNQIPFSDMDSLCDPSSPDVTGRVLEALGLLDDPGCVKACRLGLEYLRRSQEKEGSFYGRWGVNYVYGTSNVLNGLRRLKVPEKDPMVERALSWLKGVQNADGGFGEGLDSYQDRSRMGRGPSTASQTAWGLMGLLAYLPAQDVAIRRGIEWLLDRQLGDGEARGSWEEQEFTGTGFPRHFYLRYHLYRHYFPLMALGRFRAASRR